VSQFETVLFDIGGVVLTNGWDTRERAELLARYGLDREAFEARHKEIYPAWDTGAITAGTYLDTTIFYEPRGFSRGEFFEEICALSKPLEDGALGIVAEVAASNSYLVGALNNESRETNAYRFETFGLRRYFKVALSSCYLGLRKPDAAIYQRALEILGNRPERILFIDDHAENVATAAEVGMRALLFVGAGQLRQDLVELGVL
jgi:putative hydrolase of the HAD superfamily